MSSCLGQILFVFVVLPLIIVLLWKSGLLVYIQPVFMLIVDLVKELLTSLIDLIKNGFTAPSMDFSNTNFF
jgi:hypothetical protein